MTPPFRSTLAAIACLLAALPSSASAQSASSGRMQIVGRATIEAVPDMATVTVGISKRASTATEALDQNSAIARKIVDFSKKFGIAEADIQTASVNLTQTFKTVRDPDGTTRQEPDGYIATNTVRVRLRDLARAGDYLRQVPEQGVSNIGGLQFGLSNPELVADEARTKAVEDAFQRAQRIAAAAKVKLGRILQVVHPPRAQRGEGLADVQVQMRAVQVPVEAGTIRISAEVEINWGIE
jgi:uncharacterized protein